MNTALRRSGLRLKAESLKLKAESQIPNTATRYTLQAARKYRIQLKAEGQKPTANTAASYTLHAARKYRIQLKAEGLKPKAKYSCKLHAASCTQIQNTAESLKQQNTVGSYNPRIGYFINILAHWLIITLHQRSGYRAAHQTRNSTAY